jgi:hypothetical protein
METVIPEALHQVTEIVVTAAPYWWVTPLAIFGSALIAAGLSWLAIKTNRAIARKRATLDLIERSESQPYYRDLYEAFKSVRDDPTGFEPLVSPTNPTLKKQRQDVLAFLNHYELIALGCGSDVLDKDFYCGWMKAAVVRDWEATERFVHTIRRPIGDSEHVDGHNKAFSEFEKLAIEWGAKRQKELILFPPPKTPDSNSN